MAISEIQQSGYAYRVQPLDRDQASQQEKDEGEKKRKSDEKGKKQDKSGKEKKDGRINLIV